MVTETQRDAVTQAINAIDMALWVYERELPIWTQAKRSLIDAFREELAL